MRQSAIPRLLACFGLLSASLSQAAPDTWAFFGCIGEDPGIYRSTFDSATGELGAPEKIAEGSGMSFLALSPDASHLYAVEKVGKEGMLTAFSVDPKTGGLTKLNSESIGSAGACHVCITADGKTLATADYGAGKVSSFGVLENGGVAKLDSANLKSHEGSSVDARRQKSPHAHCVVPSRDGRFIYSADLGCDQIYIYEVTAPGNLKKVDAPKVKNLGGGPRHFAYHPTQPFAWTNLELTSEVTAFHVNEATGKLVENKTVSTLPTDFAEKNSTSEILCHPSGKYLYTANRGHNSIAGFSINADDGSLTPLGQEPCGGEIPRNFGITPDGGWIITANQNSGNAGVLRMDPATGKLSLQQGGGVKLPKPMCARFVLMAK